MTRRPAIGPAAAAATIVLVEDDPALRDALRFSLGVEGWAVVLRESGEDLLAQPLPAQPFCIVCDHHLPGMTGLEAVTELRRRDRAFRAILITTAPSPAQRLAAGRAKVQIVEKPLLGEQLMIAIRRALA